MRNPMYFAQDGNYGDAWDIAIIDGAKLDEHLFEEIDGVSDYDRPKFARWFFENNHSPVYGDNDYDCLDCKSWIDNNS